MLWVKSHCGHERLSHDVVCRLDGSLCDELITHSEETYQVYLCVI
jgi:hypothetical protein